MRSQMQSAANSSRLHGVSEKVASPKKWAGVYKPGCDACATQYTFPHRRAGTLTRNVLLLSCFLYTSSDFTPIGTNASRLE